MEIVKKNLLSIICGVVALLAVVALFYPLGGKKEKLQEDLESRASVYQSLAGLQSKSRTLPIIDPSNPTPVPLNRFPNEDLIKKAQAIPDAFAAQAKMIEAQARKINEHTLLVPGSLPTPMNATIAFEFRDNYRDMMTSGLARMMNAGHPPTTDELDAAKNKMWDTQFKTQLVYPNGQNGAAAVNQDSVQQAFQAALADLPANEIKRVANTCSVYMDPTALTLSAAPTLALTSVGAGAPAPDEIWYAQLGLWIQQDVAQAIIRTNSGYKNVIEGPVKRLIKINVDSRPYLLPASYQPGQTIEGDPKAAITKDINISPTGRECNAMYDVVHFDFIVNIEAAKIPWLMDELNNGQFITVLKADVKAIDASLDQVQGYIYGSQPIVQLHLTCEEDFLHDWSRPLMPKEVASNMLGVTSINGAGSAYSPDMGGGAPGGFGGPPPPGGPGGPPRY